MPGYDVVPSAAVCLGPVCDESGNDPRNARYRDYSFASRYRAVRPRRDIRSIDRRRSDPVPAHVLVLLPSGRLHHDLAGYGRDKRTYLKFFTEEDLRI